MSDDDDDYMSDKFLQNSEKSSASSLLYRHADKRKFDLIKKKSEIEAKIKEKNSIKYMEEEKRETGLSSAIASTNKGFELLMKMGYKPGQGIGKTESGITEPIGLEIKLDRHGLGKGIKRKQTESKSNLDDNKLNNKCMKDFRSRIAQKKAEQLFKADFRKSQKICEQLDRQSSIEKPVEAWYWLPQETESNTDEEDDKEDEEEEEPCESNESLEILTKYLREKYFYCIWCGVAFNNENDLVNNCPGNTRNDH
ncbi:G patch domain-containing protein 11 [Nomia melanderi]|uniref:G patch domain-containing protein 11 n=1 Tax=Nomia melanderi TaxID=2448451 RepID=UPI0013045CD6|nr:G patch domain-containing protein 11 [Nomia melanderi]XP_031840132.1 G patch domain-containing protein 11 [Nomia melanderi]XP_031840133.1 G patch domain-containing protein 11 [Nomia melanderi]XP_031840135.1 G patch domain-containing protein 11 [Nomia melanderi]XP_031840136.1 G patch domain-containing protein 11 [Nomia melanderi]